MSNKLLLIIVVFDSVGLDIIVAGLFVVVVVDCGGVVISEGNGTPRKLGMIYKLRSIGHSRSSASGLLVVGVATKSITAKPFIPIYIMAILVVKFSNGGWAETASWAESGQLQFWSQPSEILNLRSSNTPETVAFNIP